MEGRGMVEGREVWERGGYALIFNTLLLNFLLHSCFGTIYNNLPQRSLWFGLIYFIQCLLEEKI